MPRAPILILFLSWALSSAVASAAKPNIVLILADDLGWRDVATNSDGFIETPNLDKLRAEGMSFTAAYAGAANCAPSRACLISGWYTPRHGIYAVGDTERGPKDKFRLVPIPNKQDLGPDVETVAKALKKLGYATGHFGKWDLGSASRGTGPKDHGFDVSPSELMFPRDASENGQPKPKTDNPGQAADPKSAFAITKAACDFIAANKDRPFFAYVAHHAVHTPLQARPETLAKFRAKAATAKGPHVTALYAACIYDLDEYVGGLLKQLKALGLEENTLVIFTSDNGGTPASINEPLRGAKGAYYEAGIREPFFARWPGKIRAGTECGVPTINQDLYPTFVVAAGGKPGPTLDGESLLPLFEGKGGLARSSIFWHFPGYLDQPVPRGRDSVFRTRPVTVVRSGDWKLLLYHEEWLLDGGQGKLATNRAVELYNLRKDIGERTDLAQTEVAKRDDLLKELLGWIKRMDAPLARIK
jgi:arylsulfatase A-like enzyme